MANLWDLATQGVDWWQRRDSLNDAQKDIDKGFEQGRTDVQKYAEPYFNAGLEHLGQYNNMGEFNFQFDQSDPSYQWRFDQGGQAVQRSQMANRMGSSGNTLQRLTEYGQGAASQEYQAEFDRDLAAYGTNKQYHQFPIEQGNIAGQQAGQYLSDMSIGKGSARAGIELSKGQNNSNFLGAGTGDSKSTSAIAESVAGAAKYATDTLGLSPEKAAEWVSGKLGVAKDAVTGILGGAGGGVGTVANAFGGVGTGLGTGADAIAGGLNGSAAMGTLPEGFGGTYAAGLGEAGGTTATGATSVGASGFGTWAASVAGGFAVLAGVKTVVEALRGSPPIQGTLDDMSKSKDPIGFVLDGGYPQAGMFSIGDQRYGLASGGDAAPGAMLSTLVNGMDDVSSLKMYGNIDDVVAKMTTTLGSGMNTSTKHTGLDSSMTDTAAAMSKMFPKISDQLQQVQDLSRSIVSMSSSLQTRDFTGMYSGLDKSITARQNEAIAERNRLLAEINAYTDKKVERWEVKQASAGV